MGKILETKNLNKYFEDPIKFQVLKDINFSINHGEFVSIEGKSNIVNCDPRYRFCKANQQNHNHGRWKNCINKMLVDNLKRRQ